MERGQLSRRGFLQRSLTTALAVGLPAWYAREMAASALEKADQKPARDKILLGAIGIGSPLGRGSALAHEVRNHKGIEYIAVCDVDRVHRERAAKQIGGKPRMYEDFRELLDNKDVQAVLIATPDHWHTLIALEALRKGKDVYCETPLTLTIAEGQMLVKVARDTGRIFQVGSQQRSDANFRLACELVRNDRLGKIETIETLVGANPTGTYKPAPVPDGLNWDFWLGQAPRVEYVPERCHYEFRWWYEYSAGQMTDWGAHHLDIAQWALGMDDSGPVAVEAVGEAPSQVPNSYNCHPKFKITYTYGGGAKLICSDGEGDKALRLRPVDGREAVETTGIRFKGEEGKWIFVKRGGILASEKTLLEEKLPNDAVRLAVSNNHLGNFFEGIRNRKPCICPAAVGHRSATVCHIGVIALRSGKKLKWDPAQEHFEEAEANKMLNRTMRAPWKLEA